jgi:hypothetical protein
MDNNSKGVFTTLGLDILGGVLIALGWLLMRKCRGDKQDVHAGQAREGGLTRTNILFMEDTEIDLSAGAENLRNSSIPSVGAVYNGRITARAANKLVPSEHPGSPKRREFPPEFQKLRDTIKFNPDLIRKTMGAQEEDWEDEDEDVVDSTHAFQAHQNSHFDKDISRPEMEDI